MFKDVFCFPGWREISGICWKCLATPSTLREFGKEAAWRQAPLTHWDVMSRILEKGNPINGIFSAPGFTKDCCYMDWLHAVDHGAQVYDSVFFHSNFSRPFFRPCFFQDPNFSGPCVFGLAFSKTQIFQGLVFLALLFPRPKTRCSRLGVTPDFLGNLFWYTLPKLAPTRKAWQELRQWYSDNAVENGMLTLTETMLRKKANSSPKLRSKAAEARALVPFGVWFLI